MLWYTHFIRTAYYLNMVFSTAVFISKTIACVRYIYTYKNIQIQVQIVQCLHKLPHHRGTVSLQSVNFVQCACFNSNTFDLHSLFRSSYFRFSFRSSPFFVVVVAVSHFLAAANSNKQLNAKNKYK